MTRIDNIVAVGIASADGNEKVALVTGHASTKLTSALAKMVATQLIMAADLIDNSDQPTSSQVPS
jgi:hypothetical protein